MMSLNPWKSYRQVATRTAPPGQLVLMLFEGAIRFLSKACEGFKLEDPSESMEAIHNNIRRAQDIISELNYSLDIERGGEFATTMRRLYDYFDERLQASNLAKDEKGIREVIRHLTVLQEAWASMLQNRPHDVTDSTELVAA